jgi:hypothetical protein
MKIISTSCKASRVFALGLLAATAMTLAAAGLPTGLIAYWPGEDNADDVTGANPGTLVGGTTFTDGRVNRAFQLDGADDYVELGALPAVSGAQALTVMAWVRRAHGDFSVGGIVGQWNTGGQGNNRFLLYNSEGADAGKAGFVADLDGGGSASVRGTTLLPVGEWTHVAAVWRGSDGFTAIYKNGVLEASNNGPAGKRLSTVATPTAKLGEWGTVRTAAYKWPGDLDEVALLTRALSKEEIQQAMNSGVLSLPPDPICVDSPRSLVGWWPAEGNAANNVGGPAGTVNGASFAAGVVGQAFSFNGAGQGVEVPVSRAILPPDITVEGWIRRSSATQIAGDGGNRAWLFALNSGGFGFGLRPDGRLVFARLDGEEIAAASLPIADTSPHHVAVSVALGEISFFVDGVAAGTARMNPFFSIGLNAAIGRRPDTGAGSFLGLIDEPSLYDRALSAAEITGLFNASSAGKCPPPADVPNDVAVGDELLIQGSGANGNVNLQRDGFSVRGQLRLESANSSYASTLGITSGALTNELDGTVVINPGSGGARSITGSLWNLGNLDQNVDLTIGGDTPRFRNLGNWDVAEGATLVVRGSNARFDQLGGTLDLTGAMDLEGVTLRYAGGLITGRPYLAASTLVLDNPGAPGSFILSHSASRLLGNLGVDQTVWVRGDSRGGHTTLVAPLALANAGTLLLESINSTYTSSFQVAEGDFTNLPGGTVRSGAGAGGARQFLAPVVNRGDFEVDLTLTLGPAGSVHRNLGVWNIAAGQTLVVDQGQTFRQEAGELNILGAFDGVGITFDYRGGQITGQPYLLASTLLFGPAATQPAVFTLTHSDSRVLGNLSANQTLWVQGGARGGHTMVVAPQAMANAGTLLLESVNSTYTSSLRVAEGDFTNLPGGTVRSGVGAGGARQFLAPVINRGLFDVDLTLTLGPAGAMHRNLGVWDIAAGQTLLVDQGQTFRQEAGELNILGVFEGVGITFDYRGGQITGRPYLLASTLQFGPGVPGAAAFILTHSDSRLLGNVGEGQTVWIRGEGRGSHTTVTAPQGFANAGTLLLESINSTYTSSLRVGEGILTILPTGIVRSGIGAGGARDLAAPLLNYGLLDIQLPTTLGLANATHRNEGDVVVATTGNLTLNSGQTWEQVDGLLDLDGVFHVRNSRFANSGGLVDGTVNLVNSAFEVGPGAAGGLFLLTGSGSQLAGEAPAGVTVLVQGNGEGGHTTVTASDGYHNHGTLRLASGTSTYTTSLQVTGELLNDYQGTVEILPGAGGERDLQAQILNRGTLHVGWSATIGETGEPLVNEGRFEVSGGSTAILRGPLLNSGGELTGTGIIVGELIHQSGTITPTGSLTIAGPATVGADSVVDVVLGQTEFRVNGALSLAGQLRGRFPADHTPVIGQVFTPVSATSLNAPALRFELPPLPAGMRWTTRVTTQVILTIEASSDANRQLTGTIRDNAGQPVAGLVVQVMQTSDTGVLIVSATTSAAGNYVIQLSPGEWQVQPVGLADRGFADLAPVTVADGSNPVTVNFTAQPRVVSGPPDLVAVNVIAPAESAVGGSFEVVWTTRNTGVSAVTAPWTETVLVSAFASGFRGQVVATVPVTASLAPDAQVERRATITVPADLRGTVYVVVKVDSALQVNEEQFEGNNTSASGAIELRIADLEVVSVTAPDTLTLGSPVSVTYVIRNRGLVPATASWRDRLSFSTTTGGGVELASVVPPLAGPLAPGESYTNTVQVTPAYDPGSQAGTRFLVLHTDHTLVQAEESDANNFGASAAVNANLPPPADLLVTSVKAPAEFPAARPVWVEWTLKNNGVSDAVGPWSDALQLADAADATASTELVRVLFAGSIPPGGSITLSNQVIVPVSLAGPRFLRVFADVANQLREDDDTVNNLGATAATSLVTAPNLVAEALTVPSSGTLGQLIQVSWTVRNIGTAPVTEPWTDRIIFHGPAGPVTLLEQTTPDQVPLPLGESYERTVDVRLPLLSEVPAAPYPISLFTDANLEVAESNEADNTRARGLGDLPITIELPPLPDLELTSILAPENPLPGSEADVVWTVTNRGTASATAPWQESLAISGDNVIGSDAPLATLTIEAPLAAGASVTRTNRVRLPVQLTGSFWFVAATDTENQIVETAKANNTGISTSPVTLPAKLTLDLATLNVSEGASPAILRGRLFRSGPLDTPLIVTLASSDAGELTTAANVTMPIGAPAVDVSFGIVADGVVDGVKVVTLNATAEGFVPGTALVTVQDIDQPRLNLALLAPVVVEGLTVGATVSRPTADTNELAVNVTIADPGLMPPASVVIPANQTSVTITLIALDDDTLTLARTAEIVAAAEGYLPDRENLRVDDNDNPGLSVVVDPATFSEAAGGLAAIGRVTRSNVSARPLIVQLRVSDDTETLVLPTVLIRGGQASAEFYVSAVNDNLLDGNQVVELRAFVSDAGAANPLAEATPVNFTVTDDDGPTLRLALGGTLAREGRSPALTAILTRNSSPATPLTVTLVSSDETEARVPAQVTIPANETSVTFPVVTLDDGTVDGNQRVTLTATADGYAQALAQFTVTDGDLPDLIVSELTVPATGLTRDLFPVGYRITNQGFDNATGSLVQKVVLSRDPVLSDDDKVLDETPFNVSLPPGESFSRELSLFLPAETGDWWIFVVADASGVVRETLEDNNTARSRAPVRVEAAYSAVVQTDVNSAPAGTPIPFTGLASRPNETPAVGELVNIHVLVNGARRILPAVTDTAGRFNATFQPLPSEGGTYTVGAVHPGVEVAPVQDTFSLLAMRLTPNFATQVILPGDAAVSEFELENLSDQPLTGISARAGAVEGLNVHLDAPGQLGPGATARVRVTSTVPVPRDAAGRFMVMLESVEGAKADATIDYLVELPIPRLTATPGNLKGGMVRDRRTLVEFTVMNTGGAETGPLNLTLPETSWMKSVTESPLPSLQPGESTTITLALTPDATLPLQEFDGRLAIGNPEVGVLVPFLFRHVSEATGDVRVTVTDENTYYGNNANLAGALVTLRDAISGEMRFSGESGTNGIALITGISEGTYNLEVSAPKHDNWLQTIQVKPGTVNENTVFLRSQLIRYKWTVEEIDIEERATVKLETIFETTVPAPVVTVDPPMIDLSGTTEDEVQFELKFTNHGLIAAQDVLMNFADGSDWTVHPLVEDLGIIPAKSSITVPVVFRRIPGAAASRHGIARAAAGGGGCQPPSVGIDWRLICGPFGVAYWLPVPVIDPGNCGGLGSGGGGGGGGGGGFPISSGWGGGGRGPSGPGRGFQVDVRVGTHQPTTYEKPNKCACDTGSYVDKCVQGEAGYKGQLEGFASELVNTAIASLAYTRVLGLEVNVNGAGKLCTCCADVEGQGVVGLKAEGSLSASITAKVFFGPSVNWKQSVSVPGISEAQATFFGGAGVELTATGYATLKASTQCLLQDPQVCLEGGIASGIFAGGKVEAAVEGKLPGGAGVAFSAAGSLGVQTGFRLRAKKCIGNNAPAGSLTICRDAVVAVANVQGGYQDMTTGRYVQITLGGERELVAEDCPGETPTMAEKPAGTDAEVVAGWFGYSSPAAFAAAVNPQANVSALLGQPSAPTLSEALLAGLPQRPAADAPSQVIYEAQVARSADEAAAQAQAPRAARPRRAAAGGDGVCAQVRLVIEQEAVVTRKAIGATLEISNESDDTPIENLGVTINIYDAAGNLANDRFVILKPELMRLTPMAAPTTDGFIINGEPLSLAAASTGSARWVILPTDAAAPEEPQQYFVGGVLAYTAGGVPGSAELTPGQVTVYPNAKLYLKYFHQRDVFADDPFTDEVEPSIPFLLGVMVENRGNGVARNMSITSAQPEIVENVKGLLIDFTIIATEVAGKNLTPSLTATFGDIAPHDTAIGRWFLKSTLQGLFIDYKATLEHDDRFGERGASVFEGVEIHEMIHQVEALGTFADNKPDFLVNDEPDDEDLPDTVHLSDATKAPVTVVRSGTPDGAPTANDLEVVLTAPLPAGFAYLRIPDPADGTFRLTGVRRSDGRQLAVGINAWTTDRTFLGMSKRPRYENVLHLFDHDSTGSYTLSYARDERTPDTTAPVSRVAALPPTSPALIPLSWTGSDDALGTGIATFDIFVSVDGGPFTRWQQGTKNTSALYQGAAGRRYAFYSVARDGAGNAEPTPLAPQASTLTTGNSAPGITAAPSASVDEGQPLEIQIEATDADVPGDTLAFSLVTSPGGMQINPATGRINWQTAENDGPKTHNVTVRVTDNGEPPLNAERNLTVTVRELNAPPALADITTPLKVNEGGLLNATLTASDNDLPAQPLRYRLGDDAPSGMSINAASGNLRWVPDDTFGGSTVAFSVIVSDGGSPDLSDTNTVVVQVLDTNVAPTLEPIPDQVVWEGDLLTFTALASDADVPADTLRFALELGAPGGAAIGALNGVFTWTPVEAEVPNTNHITVTVTDDAPAPLSDSQTFKVVSRALKLGLNRPQRFANGDLSFRFKGTQGQRYVLEGSPNFTGWIPLREFVAEQAIFTITDQTSAEFPIRYFRARPVE